MFSYADQRCSFVEMPSKNFAHAVMLVLSADVNCHPEAAAPDPALHAACRSRRVLGYARALVSEPEPVMQYKNLPGTDLNVSRVCLGTMTWGEQNTEDEAHEQLDYSIDQGINFIDTAEMYPVPPNEKTQGRTETY